MLLSIENIIGCPGYFIDDVTYDIYSFKQYKEGRKIKLNPNSRGYLHFNVYNEGIRKYIKYHQLIVKVFIDPNYDSKTQDIDHLDHNRQNNSIDNLKVVSKSGNHMNRSYYGGKQVEYIDDIGENIPVNAEHGVYYSKTFDKFYRFVNHIGKFRQMTEGKHHGYMQIGYKYNKKSYNINCSKFRKELSK